ncbi:MAG: hypothetical protein ACRDUX_36600 [Mycobacterium sp.]
MAVVVTEDAIVGPLVDVQLATNTAQHATHSPRAKETIMVATADSALGFAHHGYARPNSLEYWTLARG